MTIRIAIERLVEWLMRSHKAREDEFMLLIDWIWSQRLMLLASIKDTVGTESM